MAVRIMRDMSGKPTNHQSEQLSSAHILLSCLFPGPSILQKDAQSPSIAGIHTDFRNSHPTQILRYRFPG